MTDESAVEFKNVDIIFGKTPEKALPLVDRGASRDEILQATGNVLGVAGACLGVREGEVCVLMGLSGSGKSTLLRAVNRLNEVTRGEVLVSEGERRIDVARCDAGTLRRMRMNRVAMVFQQFALLPWRTVAENVGLGLELRGVSQGERERIVREKLALVGLDQWRDKYAHELSGGMQQRVGLARAFATDAEILLMDEPFSALDPLIRNHLQDELLDLQQGLRKTIIFVSHDLDEALKLGTHIAIMEGGRIVQVGEPEEIVLNPASRYVAEFVAHMNPLNVLKGHSLMTPAGALTEREGALLLDAGERFAVRLDDEGRVLEGRADGRQEPVRRVTPGTRDGLESPCFVLVSAEVSMREAIVLRQQSRRPVLLEGDGRFVGVVGDEEMYRGILRQTRGLEKAGA